MELREASELGGILSWATDDGEASDAKHPQTLPDLRLLLRDQLVQHLLCHKSHSKIKVLRNLDRKTRT